MIDSIHCTACNGILYCYLCIKYMRIRVQLHVSLLGHALTSIDMSDTSQEVLPYVGQVDWLHAGVRVLPTTTAHLHEEGKGGGEWYHTTLHVWLGGFQINSIIGTAKHLPFSVAVTRMCHSQVLRLLSALPQQTFHGVLQPCLWSLSQAASPSRTAVYFRARAVSILQQWISFVSKFAQSLGRYSRLQLHNRCNNYFICMY